MISITGGTFKRKKLDVPKGQMVRPTLNKVREAIFNVLSNHIDFTEVMVLDLYAGSGAMGIEAISRGTSQAIFVEKDSGVFRTLKKNVYSLPTELGKVALIRKSAREWLPTFHGAVAPCVVFMDPPYYAQEYEKMIPMLADHPYIPQSSLLVIESPVDLHYIVDKSFQRIQVKQYGQINVNFLRKV